MIKQTVFIILIWMVLSCGLATEHSSKHMLTRYNIVSLDPAISDKQCEGLLAPPFYYTQENGNMHFLNMNADYNIDKYEPLNKTPLGKEQLLYTGVMMVHFELNGQLFTQQERLSFVLNRDNQILKGNFIIPGLCKGNLIGWLTHI